MPKIFGRLRGHHSLDAMTNEEAAHWYLERARRAEKAGDTKMAQVLYQSAALLEPANPQTAAQLPDPESSNSSDAQRDAVEAAARIIEGTGAQD